MQLLSMIIFVVLTAGIILFVIFAFLEAKRTVQETKKLNEKLNVIQEKEEDSMSNPMVTRQPKNTAIEEFLPAVTMQSDGSLVLNGNFPSFNKNVDKIIETYNMAKEKGLVEPARFLAKRVMAAALATKKMAFIEVDQQDDHYHLEKIDHLGNIEDILHDESRSRSERRNWDLKPLTKYHGFIPDEAIADIPPELVNDAIIATPNKKPLSLDPVILFPLNNKYAIGFYKW